MLCVKCGASLGERARVCLGCGTVVTTAVRPSPTVPVRGIAEAAVAPADAAIPIASGPTTLPRPSQPDIAPPPRQQPVPAIGASQLTGVPVSVAASPASPNSPRRTPTALPAEAGVETAARRRAISLALACLGGAALVVTLGMVLWQPTRKPLAPVSGSATAAVPAQVAGPAVVPQAQTPVSQAAAGEVAASTPPPVPPASAAMAVAPDPASVAVTDSAPVQPDTAASVPRATAILDVQHLSDLMNLALQGDWAGIDEQVAVLGRASFELGDRKAARALNRSGLDSLARNDFAPALELLERASATSRGDVEIRNNLAYAELRAGRPREAVAYLFDTLAMDPTRAAAWMNLAEALAELGQTGAADAGLRMALHFSRDQARAIDYLSAAGNQISSTRFRAVIDQAWPRLQGVPQRVGTRP